MTKRAFASPFHDFCQEQRPLLPADLKGSEKEKLLGQRWQALSPAAKAKRKALLIPVFTCGRGGARTWVPATLEPEVTEAAVEDFMAFVLMDHDIERHASSDRDDVVEWLGLAAGLHAAAVNEAKPRLRREQVFVVGDLALLEEEGGLGSVFTTLVSARRVRDALRLRSGHQPATVGCPAGGLSGSAEEAVLDGTLLGSLPAQAEPETAAGLTHEHVVSYGAQDAVDCSTRPPDPPQALEWLTEFFGTLEGDGGGSERPDPNLPTTSPTPVTASITARAA